MDEERNLVTHQPQHTIIDPISDFSCSYFLHRGSRALPFFLSCPGVYFVYIAGVN